MTAPPIAPLLQHPATLLTRTYEGAGTDEYGNPLAAVAELETRCELQQSGARDELDGAVQVVTWRVFLPPDAPAMGWDALRLADGRVLELAGNAWAVSSPRTGELHHVEAYVTETA
jgi:hypothetical protein